MSQQLINKKRKFKNNEDDKNDDEQNKNNEQNKNDKKYRFYDDDNDEIEYLKKLIDRRSNSIKILLEERNMLIVEAINNMRIKHPILYKVLAINVITNKCNVVRFFLSREAAQREIDKNTNDLTKIKWMYRIVETRSGYASDYDMLFLTKTLHWFPYQ